MWVWTTFLSKFISLNFVSYTLRIARRDFMDISRWGAERFRGTTDIVTGLSFITEEDQRWKNNVRWDSEHKYLEICPKYVWHTDGVTRYNYSIRLTLDDISSLIALLGHAGSKSDAKLLRDHLSKHVPAIVKLLACATGVAPIPLEENTGQDN